MKLEVSTLEDLKERCINNLKATANDMQTLQNDRATAINTYLSGPYGDEVQGRSQFVTSDLSDVVESIMPSLMRTFYGNKNVVSLLPVGIEDETAAKLMEEKVNYDFTAGLNGYTILDTWFRDSLYQKIGVIKYYWHTEETYKAKEYTDLTEPEYLNLLQQADEGKLIIGSEEVTTVAEGTYDETTGMATPAEVRYDLKCRKVTKISKPVVENVPPEEFIFDLKAKSIADCEFIAHKKRVHKSYLKKYNVKDADIDAEIESFETDTLYTTRFESLGGIQFFLDQDNPDFVFIYECYLDQWDKDGNKKPMKMVIMGNKVIDSEENKYGRPPFCILTPINIPHRMVGRDFYDLVAPIQKLHSYYVRYINDNLAYQNNGMRVVNPFRVQMDDVLSENNPGGIWRTKYDIDPARVVHNLTPTPIATDVYGMIDKMDNMRQERTGITKYQAGMDSKSLNRTASGISQIMGAAQQRVELIARNYAETGVKDLFQALVDLNLDFFDAEINLKLNNEWQTITPEMIDGHFDILVDVGASMGSAEIQVNQIMMMMDKYAMVTQMGAPVPPKYIYNCIREVWQRWGYKNVDMYAPKAETIGQDMQEAMAQMPAPPMPPGAPMPPPGGMPPEGMM